MRETAWVVLLAVVVVFVLLVAVEVGKRSQYRSPVDRAADLFTRADVRNVAPMTEPMGAGVDTSAMLDLAS